MQQVIRICDYSLSNSKYPELIFTSGSDIKKFCDDKDLDQFEYYHIHKLDIDYEKVTNNKISILEECGIYGCWKQTIIYENNYVELLDKIKENMKIIPSREYENEYCNVELFESVEKNDSTNIIRYYIVYKKITSPDGEDITQMFYDSFGLITNIPIIDYH